MSTKNETYVQTPDGRIYSTSNPEHWKDAKRLTKKEGRAALREQHRQDILKIVKPGDTIHCVLRSVSRSGMQRKISLFAIHNGELQNITGWAANVLDWPLCQDEFALKVGGCGMDMGFHSIYCLGRRLWPEGTPEPHSTRNGAPDRDGGYALKSSWL